MFGCYVLLRVGAKVLDRHDVPRDFDGSDGFFAARVGRGASLLLVRGELDDLAGDDQAAGEELLMLLGAELLAEHDDPRGVLLAPGSASPDGTSYEKLVRELEPHGRWVPNLGPTWNERAVTEDDVPLPPLPGAKPLESFVMPVAGAVRELALTEAPLRVACRTSLVGMRPVEVSAFYLPQLKAKGFAVKRRIWSDGSAEELVATRPGFMFRVHSERMSPSEVFVRVAHVMFP